MDLNYSVKSLMMMHNQNMKSYKSRKDMLNISSQENNALIDSKYNGKKAEKRFAVRIPFREHDGLFSNLIIPINTAWCYQQYDIVCTGWPSDIRALIPNMCVESNSESVDIQLPTLGTPFYIPQNPIILASPAFFGMRLALNAMLEPNGIFAPAQHVIEIARAWWEKNVSDATFVVGVHGRAACHYADPSLDLETHTLLLCVEAEEEIRQTQGAKILVSSCNESIVEHIRSYFEDIEDLDVEVAWRRPEGHINHGNVDWGETQQRVNADIATGALVDAILLSMCDVVVCGSSNVILYSAALRPTMRIRVARHLARVRGF
jgi:hypothetical protein